MSPERDAFDEYVYRGIDLERYADHIQYRTQGYLEELYDELQGELARINPGEHLRWRDQRLLRLARIVEPLVKKTYGTITDEMSEDMGALAGAEANWVMGVFNKEAAKYQGKEGSPIMDVAIMKKDLANLHKRVMIQGAPSGDWWANQEHGTKEAFIREVRKGVLRGESIDEMARRIRGRATGKRFSWYTKKGEHRWHVEFEGGVMQLQTRDAKALIRTTVQSVAAQSRREMYMANSDVVKGIEQVSTLDNRTTKICMAYDGESWEWDDEDYQKALTEQAQKYKERSAPHKGAWWWTTQPADEAALSGTSHPYIDGLDWDEQDSLNTYTNEDYRLIQGIFRAPDETWRLMQDQYELAEYEEAANELQERLDHLWNQRVSVEARIERLSQTEPMTKDISEQLEELQADWTALDEEITSVEYDQLEAQDLYDLNFSRAQQHFQLLESHCDNIRAILDAAPTTTEEMHVWRAQSQGLMQMPGYEYLDPVAARRAYEQAGLEGMEFTESGIFSTTTRREFLEEDSNFMRGNRIMTRVHIPAGTPGLYVQDSELQFGGRDEWEYILPPGYTYRVVGMSEVDGKAVLELAVVPKGEATLGSDKTISMDDLAWRHGEAITSDESEALDVWAAAADEALEGETSYRSVQGSLRGEWDATEEDQSVIDLIDSAIDRVAADNPAATVYRGSDLSFLEDLGFDMDAYEAGTYDLKDLVGKVFEDPGYQATAWEKDTVEKFLDETYMPVLWEIETPEGTRAVSIEWTQEYLLARGSKLEIIDVWKRPDGTPVIKARVVT